MRNFIVLLSVPLLLCACARPGPSTLQVVRPLEGAKQVLILVASDRQPANDRFGSFSAGRSETLHYREVVVSIPPGHRPAEIEWPSGSPDPAKSFAVVRGRELSREEFVNRARGGGRAAGAGSVGLFVHGYNYTYQEALFRLAQMAGDSDIKDVPILFDWPSQGSLTGYLSDRDSAAFARDDLAGVLADLSKGGVRTTILAHSVGSWLAIEAVRQLHLSGQLHVLNQIDQIVLAAPDIDVDLLDRDLATTGRLEKPIVILAAKDDRALAISRQLSGAAAETGALDVEDPRTIALARKDNLQIIDISKFPATDGTNHDRFAALAAVYPQLAKAGRQTNAIAGTGSLILNGVGAVVSAPFRVGGALLTQ